MEFILIDLLQERNYYVLSWMKPLQLSLIERIKSYRQRNCYNKVRLRKSTVILGNPYGQYEGCMDNMKVGKPELEIAFRFYARKSGVGRKIIKIIMS